ncbi:oxidative stress-responsive serine-rich protein 1-like [Tiliqua scincoides]|uniref:oxidative stress-responsive serine-rich protein 1-like n=1 Tax=Tiliqua scincoides TaxID=71010 RepID=UPI0034623554
MLEIEENLQAAFKKLRVDAEGSIASLSMNEGISPRALVRNTEEAKVKHMYANKESWHWCLRKPVRGMIRIQRQGRSKSPVLHPPKFIHCSPKMPSCTQPVHKSPDNSSESGPGLNMLIPMQLSKNGQVSHPFNGADQKQTCAEHSGTLTIEIPKNQPENDPAVISLPIAIPIATDFSDFQSVSEKNKGNLHTCAEKTCQCKQWQDMKVYVFSGLQNSPQSAPERRTHVQDNFQSFPSGIPSSSLKSCSEQARASVDDVTIEDLSGYVEDFLHIPKEMSHMAEMMYN